MAGVAVLQPHDVLKHHRQNYAQPLRSRKNSNSTPIPNPNPKNNRRKRSPQKNNGSANLSNSPPAKNRHLVMGEVKILKRGDSLTNKSPLTVKSSLTDKSPKVIEDFVLSTTDRLGPEPYMVPKQINISDFYAGSAFVTSPPPSELPVPAFFNRKSTDDATSDLRRLLRLE